MIPEFIYKLKYIPRLFNDRYGVVFFDRKHFPVEGDTITVGELVAEFKKKKDAKK